MHFAASARMPQSGIEHLPDLKRQSPSCKHVVRADDLQRAHEQTLVVVFQLHDPETSALHAADDVCVAHDDTWHAGGESCHEQRLSAQHDDEAP